MHSKSNRRIFLAVLFGVVVISAGLWLWKSEPRHQIVFRSNVGNDYELLVAYQDTKGKLDADRLVFGDVSGTLSYAFVKDGNEPRWVVEAKDVPDAFRGYEITREADGALTLRDV